MVKKLPESLIINGRKWKLYDDVDYEAFWEARNQKSQDRLEKYVISKLLPRKGKRIIDVGCGYGRLYDCYKNRFSTIILFDGSIYLLKKARQRIQENKNKDKNKLYFIAGDINHLPFKEAAFDYVLMIRVLQHIFELKLTLAEIKRVLSRSGVFVFSYHNKQNIRRIINWLTGKEKDNPFCAVSKEVSPALISHHPRSIRRNLGLSEFVPPLHLGSSFINQIGKITKRYQKKAPVEARLARIMGMFWLSPWLIGKTRPKMGTALIPGDEIIDILACPICHGPLHEYSGSYECLVCKRIFVTTEGILDFRPF